MQMEAGKTLDIVRTEVDLLQLVHDVHCIIEAMVGRNGNVSQRHTNTHIHTHTAYEPCQRQARTACLRMTARDGCKGVN